MQAIVVNLEHIKAIITKEHVLVVNPEDDRVLRFINDLKASSKHMRGSRELPSRAPMPASAMGRLGETEPGREGLGALRPCCLLLAM